MQIGPHVKLAIDIQMMERFFPREPGDEVAFGFDMVIDRPRYDEVNNYMSRYGITDPTSIQEFCFIILWIENNIGVFEDKQTYPEKFRQMWQEIDGLKEFLLNNRVTSIDLIGEREKNSPGKRFVMKDEINIDRICDGLRSVFSEEFLSVRSTRKTRGKKAWRSRKMVKTRNYILNYMAKVPGLDELSLEEQSRIIDKLSIWSGVI